MTDKRETSGKPRTAKTGRTDGANRATVGTGDKRAGASTARTGVAKQQVDGRSVGGRAATGAEPGVQNAPSEQRQLFRPAPVPTRVDYSLLEGEIQHWWD